MKYLARCYAWVATAMFVVASLSPGFADNTSVPVQEITSDAGLRVSLFADGGYRITADQFGWIFAGTVATSLSGVAVSTGSDAVGSWREIDFNYATNRSSGIRLYAGTSIVLFSTTYASAGPNSGGFPHFTTYPQGLSRFGYDSLWTYRFGPQWGHTPWLFYDSRSDAFILSPASNFMTGLIQTTNTGIQSAIDSRIPSLPAGFSHTMILAVGQGINRTWETWGQTLTQLWGKNRSSNDSIPMLNKLSYWTDNQCAYYYRPGDGTQYIPTLLQMRPAFAKNALAIGSLELDSWHYPKGSPPSWTNNGAGMASFRADSTLFPQGLGAFQSTLGIPLITHARWIDVTSDLRNNYKMSGNVSIDPAYWRDYSQYLSSNGVTVMEQDWLDQNAATDFNLTDPDAFLDNMAGAMGSAGVNVVYSMPLWTHIMQSAKYSNVVSARVSNDGFGRARWDEMLINSRIVSAVGLWPFADTFQNSNPTNVLLATLTAGPLGSGDAMGGIPASSIDQAILPDGVIVKPDVPIVPTDATFIAMSQDQTAPMIASTYTDHGGLRTGYVFAYERINGAIGSVSFAPESLGITGAAYVYDYFHKTGQAVNAGSLFNAIVDYNGSYFVVAPIGPSGMALLGDVTKFVSAGRKRITNLSDDGTLHVTVHFASGEAQVVLQVYAPGRIGISTTAGHAASLMTGDLHRVIVTPDSTGQAIVHFRNLGKGARAGQ